MSPDERDFDAEGPDELLYEEIRAAYDRVSLPPHRLRAMIREAERSPAGAPMRLVTGALIVLAAVVTFVLVAWPSRPSGEDVPSTERIAPATPPEPPQTPEPPEPPLVPPERPREPPGRTSEAPAEGRSVELRVRSDRRAILYLDGQITGYLPQDLEVRPGPHELRAALPGVTGGLVQQIDARGEPLVVEFTFGGEALAPPDVVERVEAAEAPGLPPPDAQGVWIGSTKPRDRALKFVVERQAQDGTFRGSVSVQLDDGVFVEHEMAGRVEPGGALSFRGGGMTFTGRLEGRSRASGTYTARTGAPSAPWSVMRAQ